MVSKQMIVHSFKLNKKFNESIKTEILGLKNNWKKGLKNVKALNSGYKPNYLFFDIIKKNLSDELLKITGKKYKPSWWWANYYDIGQHTNSHVHEPEKISSIIIIKSDRSNPLFFDLNPGILKVEEQEGLVLLFDSKLIHGVKPCKEERISLAVDFILDI
tara:strand:+ start:85 stop:564 length:480 start_codon:yes stop_codon:yes gene_type:complete